VAVSWVRLSAARSDARVFRSKIPSRSVICRFADRRISGRNLDFQIALESKSRGFTQGEGHFRAVAPGLSQ